MWWWWNEVVWNEVVWSVKCVVECGGVECEVCCGV